MLQSCDDASWREISSSIVLAAFDRLECSRTDARVLLHPTSTRNIMPLIRQDRDNRQNR